MISKYFISTPWHGEKEVTKEQFIEAEIAAGFYGKIYGEPATWDFCDSKTQIKGRQEKLTGERIDG